MYTVTRTGPSARDVGAELRALVRVDQPRVMAKALTFTAQRGQKDLQAEMPKVFAGGATRYTLNSTRIVSAKPESLVARVAVKDETTNNGNVPEDYLFPQVFGGPRKEKRFERAMRYAGALRSGQRVVLGQEAPVDAFGNLKRGEIQRILTATRTAFDPYQRKTNSARSRRNARNAPYFIAGLDSVSIVGGEAVVKKSRLQAGVYRREGRGIRPVLIFVNSQPSYRRRLDFEGVVQRAAEREFPAIFARLLRAETRAR